MSKDSQGQMELCASLLFQLPLGDALMNNYNELEVKKYEVRELDNQLAIAQEREAALEGTRRELLQRVGRLEDQLAAQKNQSLPAEEKQVMADAIAGARELLGGGGAEAALGDALGQAASLAADLAAGPQWSLEQWLQGLPLAAIVAQSIRGVLTSELGTGVAGIVRRVSNVRHTSCSLHTRTCARDDLRHVTPPALRSRRGTAAAGAGVHADDRFDKHGGRAEHGLGSLPPGE